MWGDMEPSFNTLKEQAHGPGRVKVYQNILKR